MHNRKPVGTVRVDFRNAQDAVVRMVAVSAEERNRGHGGHLLRLVENFAMHGGRTRLVVNANPSAHNFYKKNGFTNESWDEKELIGVAAECIQMTKILR